VVEIQLGGTLDDDVAQRVQEALGPQVDEAVLNADRKLLTVRALNAVAALPAILNRLEEIGLGAGEVRVRENTLEDVFIQLTGRRLRE
jgi:hypothetical protein